MRISRAILVSTVLVTATVAVAPAPAASALTAPSSSTVASYVQQVFNLINSERASLKLPAYRWNTQLAAAAKGHNAWMAKYNTLSHQLSGEHSLGGRITLAGYTWTACAENIALTTNGSITAILNVQKAMFAEVAPNDGHRRAIVSTTYRDVGLDLRYDTVHGKVWLTEDFARHA